MPASAMSSRRASSAIEVGLPAIVASSRLCAGVMYAYSLRRTPLMISRANQSERVSSSCLRLAVIGGAGGRAGSTIPAREPARTGPSSMEGIAQDEALLREAGFVDIEMFYAAFTFRGWVMRNPR